MTRTDWKEAAELIGIAAIVASLVFVGLQLRQAQAIATAERLEAAIPNRLARNELVLQSADLLAKANNNADLTDAERISLSTLIDSVWNEAFLSQRSREVIDSIGRTGPQVAFARFLFDNPGARKEWQAYRERRHRAWDITGGFETLREFDAAVEDILDSFERNRTN